MHRILLACVLSWAATAAAAQPRTLLLVVAHPDDESAFGEVLVQAKRNGDRAVVVIATDGKDGTRVTDIPAGERLGALRREESRCAARRIGIEAPIHLGIERLDTKIGTGNFFRERARARVAIAEQIRTIDPDVILTFGPEGDTGHPEHVVVGGLVTEILLAEGWVDRYPLYFLAWPREIAEAAELGFVDDRYVNVRVRYAQAEEDAALGMMPCYATQYTAEELREDRARKLADSSNVLQFRRFATSPGRGESFWPDSTKVERRSPPPDSPR
jgi:LmbE family N-acetylglucosaminyl deacetylase